MRGLILSAAVLLNLCVAGAARADIAPEPSPAPPEPPSDALAIGGTALTIGVISLGLWMRKRSMSGQIRG